MNADELEKEKGRRPADADVNVNVNVNVNVKRVDPQQALSQLDQRIENQRREDGVVKSRARRQAAAGSPSTSPVKPGAYSVTVTPSSGSPTRLSPNGRTELTQMEQDIATKTRVGNTASVVMAPGVYACQGATSELPSAPLELSQMEKDVASKALARPTANVAMAPGAYQVAAYEPGGDSASAPVPASASGAPDNSDAAIKARTRNRGAITTTTPSNLSQVEADVVAKTRRTHATRAPGAVAEAGPGASASGAPENSDAAIKARTRNRGAIAITTTTPTNLSQVEADVVAKTRRTPATRAPGAVAEAGPGALSSMTALEADVEVKSRMRTRVAVTPGVQQVTSAAPRAKTSKVVVSDAAVPKAPAANTPVVKGPHAGSIPDASLTSSSSSAPGAVAVAPVEIMSLDEQITYRTRIPLDSNEVRQEEPLLDKFQDSFRLSKDGKQGTTLQDDLNTFETPSKDMNAPHGYLGGDRDSGAIIGDGHAFDDQENLAVAVAIEEKDDNKFFVSAVEYDPDSKPPIYKNRRFRLYGGLLAIILLGLILGVVLGLVLGDDSKTIVAEDATTSAPTTFRESLGIQEQIEMVVGSDKLYDPSTSQYLALQWILHEDPSALETDDPALVQRFLLAQFYFETSQKGPWFSCGRSQQEEDLSFCLRKEYQIGSGDIRTIPSNRWLSERDECVWSGVECNDLNQVTVISLRKYMPARKLAILRPLFSPSLYLVSHIIEYQSLTGTLPKELVLFPVLQRIELPLNKFTGTLPPEWGEMNHLLYIEVRNNTLTGTIPDTWWDLGATMTGLNIGSNLLVGSIPGDRLGGMRNMKSLFVDFNRFTGIIPTEVGLLTDLRK
jgi:hypothetical protein